MRVADETGRLTLSWFNQSYRKSQLVYGQSYIFYGAVRADHPGQMANPSFESVEAAGQLTGRLIPIYPLTEGLTSRVLAASIAQALDACPRPTCRIFCRKPCGGSTVSAPRRWRMK